LSLSLCGKAAEGCPADSCACAARNAAAVCFQDLATHQNAASAELYTSGAFLLASLTALCCAVFCCL
jgi:hypothetical protein